MKKIIATFLCASLFIISAHAQYINLPDTLFGEFIQVNICSPCVTGSTTTGYQLDTVLSKHVTGPFGNPLAFTLSYASSNSLKYTNLQGIQYFALANSIECSVNTLKTIPALPPALKILILSEDSLTSLPPLPPTLTTLDCDNNALISGLPTLPASLKNLNCAGCQLSVLPALPDSLTTLNCVGNYLNVLPTLPDSLQTLECNINPLSGGLPALPPALTSLNCSYDQLTALPALPDKLNSLYCYNNSLTGLPDLPATLADLEAENNNLLSLPSLPLRIMSLLVNNNPNLACLPHMPSGYLEILYTDGTAITCQPNYFQGDPNGLQWDQNILNFPLCTTSGICAATGIPEVAGQSFELYPNPCTGAFHFHSSGQLGCQFIVTNVLGQMVYTGVITDDDQMVDLSNVEPGIYIMAVKTSAAAARVIISGR